MALVALHVHRLPGRMAGSVYLLEGDALTLVDTGMPGGVDSILDYVSEIGRLPEDLKRIVLTHYHVDHVGSAAELRERTGATVLAHRDDGPFMEGTTPQPPPRQALLRILYRIVPAMTRFAKVRPDRLVQDGEELGILGGATVIHLPGHTPGSIALHLSELGVLFCGDAIDNRRGVLGLPPPAFTVDEGAARASILKAAGLDFDVLCPGHGPAIVGGASDRVRAMAAKLA